MRHIVMNFKDGWEAPARRGLGRNGSDVEETVERFEPVLERLVALGQSD